MATRIFTVVLHKGEDLYVAECSEVRTVDRCLVAFITAILPVILYFTLLEGSEGGVTWWRHHMGLRVVQMSGERLGRGRALMRSVVKFLPWQLDTRMTVPIKQLWGVFHV